MRNAIILTILIAVTATFAQTYVSGAVSGVWDSTGSPYYVTDSICVPSGDSLRIGPGVEVIFQGHYKFCVDSAAVLKAIGTAEDSIIFTAEDTANWWQGLKFWKSSTDCELSHCRISRSDLAGILVKEGRVEILHSRVSGNKWIRGGGVNVENSVLRIEHCAINDNSTQGSYGSGIGGGIYAANSEIEINCSVLNENRVGSRETGKGGCVYADNCQISFLSCEFKSNLAKGSDASCEGSNGGDACGGCLYLTGNTDVTIKNSHFIDNIASGGDGTPGYHCVGKGGDASGGAIYIEGSNLTIENTLFYKCQSRQGLGACGYDWMGNPIGPTHGKEYGGAISSFSSIINITNNSFYGNSAKTHGNTLYLPTIATIIFNSIIWTYPGYSSHSDIYYCSTEPLIISSSNLDSNLIYARDSLYWDSSNLNSIPFFVDTASGDFHLQSSSPCIDAGAESVYIAFLDTTFFAPLFDIEGNPRPYAGGWDIGAYESPYDYIRESDIEKPKAISVSAYPNPFNGNCRIMIDDLGLGIEAIEVFDVNGRMVANITVGEGLCDLPREHTQVLPYDFIWTPGEFLGSGIYLIRAGSGGSEAVRRVIYLK